MPEAFAQNQTLQGRVLLVLAAWGALNLVGGGIIALRGSDQLQSFGQVCAAWGIINLLIGGIQTFTQRGANVPPSLSTALAGAVVNGRIITGFWVTDFATILIGIFFLAPQIAIRSASLQGLGKGLIVQGIGLGLIDTVLFFANTGYTQQLVRLVQ